MNAEQRQTAADDLWTNPTDLSHWPACIGYETTSTIAIYIITQSES